MQLSHCTPAYSQDRLGRSSKLFLEGLRDTSPILLGIAPFGAIAGVATAAAGIGTGPAFLMSIGVFAGAAHLAAVELIARDAAPAVVVLAALVVNLRYLMYSAGLAPHFSNLSWPWRGLVAYVMTDQAFAVFMARRRREPGETGLRWYYLGSAAVIWSTFQVTFASGFLLGVAIPESWSLEVTIPLTFIVLLLPTVSDRATLVAALCGGLTAVPAAALPYHLGLVTAAAVGIGAGVLTERRSRWLTRARVSGS